MLIQIKEVYCYDFLIGFAAEINIKGVSHRECVLFAKHKFTEKTKQQAKHKLNAWAIMLAEMKTKEINNA